MILALVLLAGAAVWVSMNRGPVPTDGPPPPEEPSDEAPVPAQDVSGSDIPDLPRYPGSTRVEYESDIPEEGVVVTSVRYVSTGGPDAIREFYRQVFEREGWSVVDYDYVEGEWSFFVVKGEREASLAFGPRGETTEIFIEHSEPREQTDG